MDQPLPEDKSEEQQMLEANLQAADQLAAEPAPVNSPEAIPVAQETQIHSSQQTQNPEKPLVESAKPQKGDIRLASFMEHLHPTLRWISSTIGLVALGMIIALVAFVIPARQQLDAANSRMEQMQKDLDKAASDLTTANQEVKSFQTDSRQAQAHLELVSVINGVTNTRMALANKDGVTAFVELAKTQQHLANLLPLVKGTDYESVASKIQERLAAVVKQYTADPKSGQLELERLYNSLVQLEQTMFVN